MNWASLLMYRQCLDGKILANQWTIAKFATVFPCRFTLYGSWYAWNCSTLNDLSWFTWEKGHTTTIVFQQITVESCKFLLFDQFNCKQLKTCRFVQYDCGPPWECYFSWACGLVDWCQSQFVTWFVKTCIYGSRFPAFLCSMCSKLCFHTIWSLY